MTSKGGTANYGVVFAFDGVATVRVLKSFQGSPGDGNDGLDNVLVHGNVLYGMTKLGGSGGLLGTAAVTPATQFQTGTVFALRLSAAAPPTAADLAGVGAAGRTATADFNGDGVPDVADGTGPGEASRVRVRDGATGAVLLDLAPFGDFAGGVFVGAGDIDGDGAADLVVTPDAGGGPRVLVLSGAGFAPLADFLGIDDPAFRGGVRAAVGDVNGDGTPDLIVAAGTGGGPRVAVFDGTSLRPGVAPARVVPDFLVFEPALRDGVYVTAGDLNGDGKDDPIFGGGPGGAPRVLAWDAAILSAGGSAAADAAPPANFMAGDPALRSGAAVAAKDLDGDGRSDLVVGVTGTAGSAVSTYLGATITPSGPPPAATAVDVFPSVLTGVFVG